MERLRCWLILSQKYYFSLLQSTYCRWGGIDRPVAELNQLCDQAHGHGGGVLLNLMLSWGGRPRWEKNWWKADSFEFTDLQLLRRLRWQKYPILLSQECHRAHVAWFWIWWVLLYLMQKPVRPHSTDNFSQPIWGWRAAKIVWQKQLSAIWTCYRGYGAILCCLCRCVQLGEWNLYFDWADVVAWRLHRIGE